MRKMNKELIEKTSIERKDWSAEKIHYWTKIDVEKARQAVKIFRPLMNNKDKNIYTHAAKTVCYWLYLSAPRSNVMKLYCAFKAVQGYVTLDKEHYDELIQIFQKEILDNEDENEVFSLR